MNLFALAAEAKIAEASAPLLRRVLELTSEVRWLDGEKEWLFSSLPPRNRLHNLCSKVLGVAERIYVSELRRAVSKSRRLAMCPPQRILAAFVQEDGLGQVVENQIIAKSEISEPPQPESAEGRMLAVLDEFGPVMEGEEFAEKCVQAGMNATTHYIYRLISPVICSLGRGVFCKVGTQVPPGVVEDIISRRRANTLASDHGWTSTGKLWFGTELTRMIMTAGSIRLAVFVADLVQGEWRVRLPDGTDCGVVTCRDSFIWSFRKPFAMLGAEPGDLAAFEFDLKARTVRVKVGGPDLFDVMQNADSTIEEDLEGALEPTAETEHAATNASC
jgi:hypothetical protein